MDKQHIYRNALGDVFISSTQLLSKFKNPFDGPRIAAAIAKSKSPKPEYEGLSAAEILDLWAAKSKQSTDNGTLFHNQIEAIAKREIEVSDYLAVGLAYNWLQTFDYDRMKPELVICNSAARVAGTVDMPIWKGVNLTIIDWKTNKDMRKEHNSGLNMLAPFEHIPDAEYYHYTLQLSLYARMLELCGYAVDKLILYWVQDWAADLAACDAFETQRGMSETFELDYLRDEANELLRLAKNYIK